MDPSKNENIEKYETNMNSKTNINNNIIKNNNIKNNNTNKVNGSKLALKMAYLNLKLNG